MVLINIYQITANNKLQRISLRCNIQRICKMQSNGKLKPIIAFSTVFRILYRKGI